MAGSCFCTKNRVPAEEPTPEPPVVDDSGIKQAETDLKRAIELSTAAFNHYFYDNDSKMNRYFNPFTGLRFPVEYGSVWMYTSAIESVNSILHSLVMLKDKGKADLYDRYFDSYRQRLSTLVDNLEYYRGTYTLVSYTQTKEWSVFGVNRASSKGNAGVEGVLNVYDDQQWLIRELIDSYKVTGESRYLELAEYLASYVIDGYDCTLDENGNEHGGITWGPGYYTKHTCSNGPFITPLVWLAQLYEGKEDTIEYRYITSDKSRLSKRVKKSEYYLSYARKLYDFTKTHLRNKNTGVYWDMLGAKGFGGDNIAYETINGVRFRAHNEEEKPTGEAYSYNCGSVLSGLAALYSATGEETYLTDAKDLSNAAYRYFVNKSSTKPGLYEYDITGFNNWFNGILLRGWVDIAPYYANVKLNVGTFQANLDYAWENYLTDGLLPSSLIYGWNSEKFKNNVEGMFEFAFASEYALLAKYNLL